MKEVFWALFWALWQARVAANGAARMIARYEFEENLIFSKAYRNTSERNPHYLLDGTIAKFVGSTIQKTHEPRYFGDRLAMLPEAGRGCNSAVMLGRKRASDSFGPSPGG